MYPSKMVCQSLFCGTYKSPDESLEASSNMTAMYYNRKKNLVILL